MVYNFSAGPALLPKVVLDKVKTELDNFHGCGHSILSISHRGDAFMAMFEATKAKLRDLLTIPDTHEILFLQGGATLQFAMVPLNIAKAGDSVGILHTGVWTDRAEQSLGNYAHERIWDGTNQKFTTLPDVPVTLSKSYSYIAMCSNNTIYGTQFQQLPEFDCPLVVDMSSDIGYGPRDFSKIDLAFASAQKNLGVAGITIVIAKKSLLEKCPDDLPTYLSYKEHWKANSLTNTTNTFAIYVTSLVLDWIESQGGLASLKERNLAKSNQLYTAIESSRSFTCPITANYRSCMNVVFDLVGSSHNEQQVLADMTNAGLHFLKGHRKRGGFRASLYNAQPQEAVDALCDFISNY